MCELAPHLQSLARLLPPPPAGTPGPFALCGRDALDAFFAQAALEVAEVPTCRARSPTPIPPPRSRR